MRFHFLLTNHYPYGLYKIEDHVKLVAGGLVALGHNVTYGFDDDVVPWPAVNLLVEFFNDSPVVDQVIGLKSGGGRYVFGLICHEDLQDDSVMRDPQFPGRRPSLERLLPHMDFGWTAVPCDYSGVPGGENMRFLEYGYVPALHRPGVLVRDIDVLFYGYVGPRRMKLFEALAQNGLSVAMTTGILPGYFKYEFLDRARLIADVRRVETVRFLAPARICAALHSGVTIVAEQFETGALSTFYQYMAGVRSEEFLDLCIRVARADECLAIGVAARAAFAQNTSMADNLRRAMDLPIFQELADAVAGA